MQSGFAASKIVKQYIVNTLLRHFLATDKNVRETVGFRLPAVVPIVFYNGLVMYCDKFRMKQELVSAVRKAYGRVKKLGAQEREEFNNWVTYILLSVCDNKKALVDEIMAQAENGDDNLAFEYTIIREFNKEREMVRTEGRAQGLAEGKVEDGREVILELLEELGDIPERIEQKIMEQSDLDILKKWHKLAVAAATMEEFEGKLPIESQQG